MSEAAVSKGKKPFKEKKPSALSYLGLILLFLTIIYALRLGRSIELQTKFGKIDFGSSAENSAKAEISAKAAQAHATSDKESTATPKVDLGQGESKQLLNANGLSVDEVQKLLVGTREYLPKAKILWVDDNPLNNQYQRLAMASLGIFCDAYTNNKEAMIAARTTSYDVVISDIQRDHESEDGLDTLREVRAENGYRDKPFFFYTTAEPSAIAAAASKRNISMENVTATNSPSVLLRAVLTAIPHPLSNAVGLREALERAVQSFNQ